VRAEGGRARAWRAGGPVHGGVGRGAAQGRAGGHQGAP